MQRKTYVSRLCVLLFLIIEDANVNDNPIENEVCNLTCTTTDHSRNVVFDKVPNTAIIGLCVSGVGCFAMSQYSIRQPTSVTTVLSFMHSRSKSGTWRCSYGPTFTSVSVPWATYPQTVSTTLTSNTTVDTNIDGNVTLGCLYSERAPTVTLQYEDANGNNDAMSAESFQCDATDIPCTDVDFTTYECPVVVKEETGIDNSDTYSIKLKIKVSHVQTEDVRTISTGISEKSRSPRGRSQKKAAIDKRQKPDEDGGPQSTPKETDARHLTPGRPLPIRPDIASSQRGPFDSVNSPKPIVLAPIENPSIPPSIDALDEQKTDKSRKINRRRGGKRKAKRRIIQP